jgi:hypothetical protein
MKAEVFYMENQEGLVSGLAEGLRRQLHPALPVELRKIAWSQQREVIELGQRYVKLLQASIRPEKGFQLDITVLDHYGYRFYIYVYYAFSYYANKKFQESGLRVFFPAVAVRNRMALVPTGLGKELEFSWNEQLSSPFKPLEMGGAAEVDFGDRPALDDALAQVARTARADLLQEVRAYASYQSPGELDLPAVARDLGVDLGFLNVLLKTGGIERPFYRQLTCALDRQKIELGRWTRVNLEIRNDSEVSLTELAVTISGPVEIRPARLETDLPARSSRQLPVALKPTERGEFPLEVVLALPDDRVFSGWLPVQHLWLESE